MIALRLGIVCALLTMSIGCGDRAGSGGSGGSGGNGSGGEGGHGGGIATTSATGGGAPSSSSSSMVTTSSTGTSMGCSHDECSVGPALSPSCDACAANVCAGDPSCCDAYWDATCVSEAGFVCQACQGPCSATTCPDGCCDPMSGNCVIDGCEFYGVPCGGEHPDPMTSTCSDCYNGCETCNATECTTCTPDCANKACGDPDGCGSRCAGTCGGGEFCSIALGKCTSVCDAASCPNGCCDVVAGACRTGDDDSACGAHGAHCQACSGHACLTIAAEDAPSPGGACVACDSTTCTGCCTADGHCDAPTDTTCGAAGAACVDCTLQGSLCQYQEYCADCTPDCDGKACGDSNGCGGACDGPCAPGTYCIHGMPSHADGCVTCGPDTCGGCCDQNGVCQTGSDRGACGSLGAACDDCGAQACNGVFQGDTFVNQCGACGINCPPPIPGEPVQCSSDGCGNLCQGASCPTIDGEPPLTCTLGANGLAMCQSQGFCFSGECDGCCDDHGNCVAGNLPTTCGQNGTECVDCVTMGETCDASAQRCQGCTPQCSQPNSCGYADGCGGVCTGAEGGQCVAGASCDDKATCHCDGANQALCYDADYNQYCLDVGSDPNNCGGCGRVCPTGIACVDGACDCPTGSHFCLSESGGPGVCTNLATDPAHCGDCYYACGNTACVHGACAACPSGTTSCSDGCVDLQTSQTDCGACANACPSGVACTSGVCDCGGGEIACSGTCTDPNTDANNCGHCFQVCPQGVACQGGQCVCPGGATLCESTCTNLDVDPQNCGHCGTVCSGGSCIGGTCH